ncbi:hypothetical protein CEXT_470841 [Caerostris extrusa]|uniref:Uncharacterized protein n=1 Tax=Caerostris extrusa TaxID=172846 RepID=A0AAV4WYQ0_CAEEX|nr:hypothetical protein CEXT_470841 [Caerostris extrusa]
MVGSAPTMVSENQGSIPEREPEKLLPHPMKAAGAQITLSARGAVQPYFPGTQKPLSESISSRNSDLHVLSLEYYSYPSKCGTIQGALTDF